MWLSAAASSLRRSRRAMGCPRSIPFASKLNPARLLRYGADNLQMSYNVSHSTISRLQDRVADRAPDPINALQTAWFGSGRLGGFVICIPLPGLGVLSNPLDCVMLGNEALDCFRFAIGP
jgi:hypothetical protein